MPVELYGPFGALAVFTFVVIGFIRGDIVPGYIYKSEREQRAKAETEAALNTQALVALAKVAADANGAGAKRRG